MTERTRRPHGENIVTFTGTVEGRSVNWFGQKPEHADECELEYKKGSRLRKLLILNALTIEGLMPAEIEEAKQLIETAPETREGCRGRQDFCVDAAIGGAHLCRTHCRAALKGHHLGWS